MILLNSLVMEQMKMHNILQRKFKKHLAITRKNYTNFKSTKCWICKKYDKEEVNEKDRCHITGENRSSAHKECYPNLSLTKKSLLLFIICKI